MQNVLEGISNRIMEEWLSELKDIIVEISTAEQDKERNEDRFRD